MLTTQGCLIIYMGSIILGRVRRNVNRDTVQIIRLETALGEPAELAATYSAVALVLAHLHYVTLCASCVALLHTKVALVHFADMH